MSDTSPSASTPGPAVHPAFDYLELPAPAMAETKAFYTAAFGWAWTDYGPDYAAAEGGDMEVALTAGSAPAPAQVDGEEHAVGPFALMPTADLEATLTAVEAAGGRIVTAPYPYPGGRRFHFADPSGNVLGVYRSDGHG